MRVLTWDHCDIKSFISVEAWIILSSESVFSIQYAGRRPSVLWKFATCCRQGEGLGHSNGLPAGGPVIFRKISVDLRLKVFAVCFGWGLRTGDCQQVPHPRLIFANNDAGQTRFRTLKTPASKWAPKSSQNQRWSAFICGEVFCGCFCWGLTTADWGLPRAASPPLKIDFRQ